MRANPLWVNIGADSKGSGLPEPTKIQIEAVALLLSNYGVYVNLKSNLNRIIGVVPTFKTIANTFTE
jgi:hypothetical protein